MSALAAPRNDFLNKASLFNKIGFPAKATKVFYNGAMVAIDATGYLVPAAGTVGLKVVGCIDLKNHPSIDTTGKNDGDVYIDVITGIFPMKIGASADVLVQADVMSFVYALDDNTVGKTDGGTQRPRAGQLVAIETISSVVQALVAIGLEWISPSATGGGTVDAVSAAGAISPTTDVTELAVSGTMAFTLANGVRIGQRKIVCTITAAATPVATLTAATSHGWTTISALGAVARSVELVWTANGWDLVGGLGVTAA